jgi:hypothetical protein
MAQLFISYSRVDKPFTKSLADRLKSVYSVWFDDDLRGGQVWWEEILHQIELGDIFVYLMSQESVG